MNAIRVIDSSMRKFDSHLHDPEYIMVVYNGHLRSRAALSGPQTFHHIMPTSSYREDVVKYQVRRVLPLYHVL
jgi:hypothetical protein